MAVLEARTAVLEATLGSTSKELRSILPEWRI
jgi:hypothetical protein